MEDILAKIVATHPTPEDIDCVFQVVDTIRAIPYIVTIYERENKGADTRSKLGFEGMTDEAKGAWDEAFRRFYQVRSLLACAVGVGCGCGLWPMSPLLSVHTACTTDCA